MYIYIYKILYNPSLMDFEDCFQSSANNAAKHILLLSHFTWQEYVENKF